MKLNHAKPANIFLRSVKESQRKQETKSTDKYMQHQAPGPTDYELGHVWLLTLVAVPKLEPAKFWRTNRLPRIGRKNELSRLCLNWGQPKFGYHPNGRFAYSQRPMFGLAA